MKGGCISKTTIICAERSYEGKETERLRQETHTSVFVLQTQTHIQMQAWTQWCGAVVAALAHVSMLWIQSLASFAEDHGRGKVTAFLDRAASLCHFFCLVCCACLDSGSVCLKVLPSCQTEQVDSSIFDRLSVCHFVGAAIFICFSCPPPYFPSYLPLSLVVFFLFLKAFSRSQPSSTPVSLLPSLIVPAQSLSLHHCYRQHRKLLFPSIWWQEERLQMWNVLCVPPSFSLFLLLSFH